MAMYFDESLSYETLRKHFDAAQKNGVRYIGVLQQVFDDPYAVTVDQQVIRADDCADIVRQVREAGLRPHAPRTSLQRLFDTRASFEKQVDGPGPATLADNFTPEAQQAYQRYLDDRAKRDEPARKGGLMARLFGRK